MFAASLIVFRETLEAALFVGIIAAATRQLPLRNRWLASGVVTGVAGAMLLALTAERVSAWADGIGQDLVNIAILSVALAMLIWHCAGCPHMAERWRRKRASSAHPFKAVSASHGRCS